MAKVSSNARSKAKRKIAKKKKTFTSFIAVFTNEASLLAGQLNKRIAKEYAEAAREVIKTQHYNWTPLTKKYLEKKISEGWDRRIYIRTSELLNSISWGVTHGKVWTGLPARKIHKDSGMPLHILGRILEYGVPANNLVPRPIWRTLLATFTKKKKKFAQGYRAELHKAMKRRIRFKKSND